MSENQTQNLKNHARFDPAFHFFTAGLWAANVVFAVFHVLHHNHNTSSIWYLVISVAAIVPILKIRLYAVKNQDRIIRLEERLRIEELSPVDFHAKIPQLTVDQLVGLRFASDQEVVGLAQEALQSGLNRKQIKEKIQNWRADNWRV